MFFRRTPQRPVKPLREQLADTEKSLNNSQTVIDNCRARNPHDIDVQIDLDAAQAKLDESRALQAIAYKHLENSEKIQKYYQK